MANQTKNNQQQRQQQPQQVTLAVVANNPNMVVQRGDMRRFLNELQPRIEQSLPAALRASVTKYSASLMLAMQNDKNLAECTAISLIGAMLQCSALGLEIGGPTGQCYVVPYFNNQRKVREATVQVGYKGLITLAQRSGKVKDFDAHIVYEGDKFDIELGTTPTIYHKPALKGNRTTEQMVGVYAVLRTLEGGVQVRWMNKDEIDEHRRKYAQASSKAWRDNFDEMARKTPLRALAKYTPLSADLVSAATMDEMSEQGIDTGATARAVEVLGFEPVPTSSSDEAAGTMQDLPENEPREPGQEG